MNDIRKENISIEHYHRQPEIVAAVIAQLEKDVRLCGGELIISLVCYSDVGNLKVEVRSFVSKLIQTNAELLFNLLYRIDIPQKMIESPDADFTELILKRELMKVLMRNSKL
jgi:hypothetical protein